MVVDCGNRFVNPQTMWCEYRFGTSWIVARSCVKRPGIKSLPYVRRTRGLLGNYCGDSY